MVVEIYKIMAEKRRELEAGDYKALQQGIASVKTPDKVGYDPKGEQQGES